MLFFLPSLVLILLCAAAVAYFIYAPAPARPALGADVARQSVTAQGRDREYLSYLPQGLKPGAALVIVLHGSGQSGQLIRQRTGYGFDRLADERGFAVAYPDAFKKHWNDNRKAVDFASRKEGVDDQAFLALLVQQMAANAGINPARVYLFGYSNGGHMAMRVAQERPQSVAGIAAVAANLATDDNTIAQPINQAVRVLLVNGTVDPISPYNGGQVTVFGFASRGTVRSAEATAQYFADLAQAELQPVKTIEAAFDNDPTSVLEQTWSRDGQPQVTLLSVKGGGHVIPQPYARMPRMLGLKTSAMDCTRVACQFFGI
jgi:polyhydroxybutyrate depolymerase